MHRLQSAIYLAIRGRSQSEEDPDYLHPITGNRYHANAIICACSIVLPLPSQKASTGYLAYQKYYIQCRGVDMILVKGGGAEYTLAHTK